MLSGLEIVLERIKEYPEEMNKWSDLLGEYIQYFNEAEIQAWRAVQTQMGRERFNEKVLKRLLGEDVEVNTTSAGPRLGAYKPIGFSPTKASESQGLTAQS